jgi:uncharacterized protein YwgA
MNGHRFQQWAALVRLVVEGEKRVPKVYHTLFQRLVFLIQHAGVRLGYKYTLRLIGPYSEELWEDLQRLASLGFITITPDPDNYGELLSSGPEREWILKQADQEINNKIMELANKLDMKMLSRLDLLATTLYVYHALRRRGINVEESLVRQVKAVKPFAEEWQISNAYEELKSTGCLSLVR